MNRTNTVRANSRARAKRANGINGHLSANSALETATHEVRVALARKPPKRRARIVLARHDEDWGEAVFAIRIAAFARDVAMHLDQVTAEDLRALSQLARATAREIKKRKIKNH